MPQLGITQFEGNPFELKKRTIILTFGQSYFDIEEFLAD